jgi:NADPH:quinone reductase-like Zn-dependent oxidoreductase
MRAVVCERYGPPDVLQMREVTKPTPGANELLVRVRATTVTAGDVRIRGFKMSFWERLPSRLYLGLTRPKRTPILGFELSGEVEETGRAVALYKKGDQVMVHCGFGFGGYAEYRCLPENGVFPKEPLVAVKPTNLTHQQAAAVPVGGLAALNILRKGNIKSGQKVLIYGASGSVGTFAVQIASAIGAEVTAVCSGPNSELVRSLGADTVIDYTKEDVTGRSDRYDLVFDAVGKSISGISRSQFGSVLSPGGTYLSVEMSRKDCAQDLTDLARLIEAGKVRPVIDRTYSMEQIAEAHRYVESGHKKGNVVITVGLIAGATLPDE